MWKRYYKTVEQTGPVLFTIWDQIAVRVKMAHDNDLKLVEMVDWEVTEPNTKRQG